MRSSPDELPIELVRHRAVATVRRALARSCQVSSGTTIVAAVSGGPDSVALLLLLTAIARRHRRRGYVVRVRAVHVHHHLRAEADGEATAVADLCSAVSVPFERIDVYPDRLDGSVAANARRLRYKALGEAAAVAGASAVATAHHAEDQLETLIMAVCRGAGPNGLRGMPWRRPLRPGVALIRPMMGLRKADAEAVCTAAGVDWCSDPGNTDRRTVRGRLRAEVIPTLESMWPGAARRSVGTASAVASAVEFLNRTLDRVAVDDRGWDRMELRSLGTGVVAMLLQRAAVRLAPAVADRLDQRQLADAASVVVSDRAQAIIRWPDGLRLVVDRERATLERVDPTDAASRTSGPR
ncbi:MAG: tRNA lysidine(34) synthetase TilS [Phycisphaerales bacterium]|nr:tRNA lysidine(34) synthetase TilS [Phycisphaerales bacterium]